jgi:hypothetical protein
MCFFKLSAGIVYVMYNAAVMFGRPCSVLYNLEPNVVWYNTDAIET